MQFYVRQSSILVMNMLMIGLAFFMAVFSLWYFWNVTGFLHYFFISWLVLGGVRCAVYWKYFRLWVKRQAGLQLTSEFIADEANGIKFYWADIRDMREENLYLYIRVAEPNDYLKKIKNPVNRFVASFYLPDFRINLDVIKCHPEMLIELINEHYENELH